MSKNTEKAKKDSFFNLYFTSTMSIAMALFMVGLVAFLLIWGKMATNFAKENLVVSIILNDSTTTEDVRRLTEYLNNSDYIKNHSYRGKEEALKEHIADLGDNPVDFLGYNPLKASIEFNIKANFINDVFLKTMENKFYNYPFIENIIYQKTMISDLNTNISKISIILLLISAILLIITSILINNTIRISIYSKRFIINTMKLVGAKAWFIRIPFISRFVKSGLIASFLACIALFVVGFYLKKLDPFLPLYDYRFFLPIIAIVFITGFLVSFFASLFAINKYIRMKSDDLYFI